MNRGQGNMQFFGNGLCQRGANVLAHLDLAGKNRDSTIFVDMNPGADIVRQSVIRPATSGFSLRPLPLLGQGATEWNDKDDARAESFDEITASEMEIVIRRLKEFVTLSLDEVRLVVLVIHFKFSVQSSPTLRVLCASVVNFRLRG